MNDFSRKKMFMEELGYIITQLIEEEQENAVEEILKHVFESIMKIEREQFISTNNSKPNKCNGFYKRMARVINHYFEIKVPRDRLGYFRPIFLDYLRDKEAQMDELAFKMYVKGLSTRDIESIFKEVYSQSYSASRITAMAKEFEVVRQEWLERRLCESYYFLYIDAIRLNVRRDTVEKECFYTVIGVRKDLRRDILGVYNIPQESAEGWRSVFSDLKRRGLNKVLMVISDELSGIEEVTREYYPGALHQFCIAHKKRNLRKKIRLSDREEFERDLKELFRVGDSSYSIEQAKKSLETFIIKWQKKYRWIRRKFNSNNVECYFSYLKFPYMIQTMIYTTNTVERLNKSIRKSTRNKNSFPTPDSALTLVCAALMEIEEKTYSYPVTAFASCREVLDNMLAKLRHN